MKPVMTTKLAIISQCPHHMKEGVLVGWGPTLTEIDYLATLFDEIVHAAVLYDDPAPPSDLPYRADNVRFVPLRPTGGDGLAAKLAIVAQYPVYARTILKTIAGADVVHVRAPANIALLAIVLLMFVRKPRLRWIKYAGNWRPETREAFSYTLQRWLLARGWHRGQVTVNGEWSDDPPFIHSFINPCLTDEEWAEGGAIAHDKTLTTPLRLLFIGRLDRAKGVGRALEVSARLRASGVDLHFDFIGDGPERVELESLAASLGVTDVVSFHGWVARTALGPFFARAHLMVFPTNSSEGWPKVVSEAMAYGVVPLVGAVSSIPQFLTGFRVGRTYPPLEVDAFVAGVRGYLHDPAMWAAESGRAVTASGRFRYSQFLDDVRGLLGSADLSA